MFKKLLVAVDGSDSSDALVKLVKELAKNGMIESTTLISVAQVPAVPTAMEFVVVDDMANIKQIASTIVNKFKAEIEEDGIKVDGVVVAGDPGVEISKYAFDNQYDVILIGSRGLSAVKSVVLGSVSNKLLHTAKCPVWIYKS